MKELVFIFCSVLTVIAWPVSESESSEWELFKSLYNKKYNGESEELFRFKIYMNNKKKIEKHQARYEMGEVTYTQGINKFSDMLYNEVIDTFTGYKPMPLSFDNVIGNNFNKTTYIPPKNIVLPDEVNWIKKGAVTAVKDQGSCGSCWAFSSTGSLEGLHFLKTGKLVSLSEQNLVDCSWDTGNYGCEGGLMTYAFTYIKENKGIDTEKSYPYIGIDGICSFNRETIGATVNGFVHLPKGDEDALKSAVATIGPISVAIDVVPSFLKYKGGVYKSGTCFKSEYHLNHAVLVVGYGTDNKTNMDYWLVKNSWGKNWGEDGFIRMYRGDNECGIAMFAVYPKV